jgi:hypothetical protein
MKRTQVTTAEAIAAIKASAKRHLDARMSVLVNENQNQDEEAAEFAQVAVEAHHRNLAAMEVCQDMEDLSAFLAHLGLEDLDIFIIVAEAFADIRDA